MKIHHEGFASIGIAFIVLLIINFLCFYFLEYAFIRYAVLALSLLLWIGIVAFFRIPERSMTYNDNAIIAPADGKIVIIKEIYDKEYFKDKRLQISIFMSPANVHVNRYSISGKVVYSQYHPGKYLIASLPKSSEFNEHHSTVISNDKIIILEKQIAGFIARRIVNYAHIGNYVKQNDEMGFIKFGSRVDVFLPIGTIPNVNIGDHVTGGMTILAKY